MKIMEVAQPERMMLFRAFDNVQDQCTMGLIKEL
jgi:hypothetical protein